MPTATFKKLAKDKQQRVIKAAIKEFSRAPLNEASVANIITDANIPRGSFYQYFKDKEELFYYIFEMHSNDIKKRLTLLLMNHKGDIFKTFIDLYKYIIEKINKPENDFYFKNIFLNMSYNIKKKFTPNLEDNLNEIINLIDISKLNIVSKLQLIYIVDIMEAILIRNIIQSYKRNVSKEKNIEIFIREITLICEGVLKKEIN